MIINIAIEPETKVLVKEKEKIELNQPLWEYSEIKNIEIDIAHQLKIKPNNIFDYLKKFINDEIKENEIIAEKKTIFSKIKILAPHNGFIKEINHESGIIIFSSVIKKSLFPSFLNGEVEKINQKEIRIKIADGNEYAIKKNKMNNYFGGEVFYFKDNHFNALDVKNKIMVVKKLNPLDQIKSEALGVKGFVSLNEKAEESDTPIFIIKDLNDFNKIEKQKKSTCIILKNDTKLIFYG